MGEFKLIINDCLQCETCYITSLLYPVLRDQSFLCFFCVCVWGGGGGGRGGVNDPQGYTFLYAERERGGSEMTYKKEERGRCKLRKYCVRTKWMVPYLEIGNLACCELAYMRFAGNK